MKPKVLALLERCIDDGAAEGYRRAHKHITDPDEDALLGQITSCIMSQIFDYFDFEELKD